ncbi:MAG: hypothetical protein HQK60_18060 [Deltaproteobacteria bacterium]|nr:hypothetical protein [Deltaproteobacteria bacterium]
MKRLIMMVLAICSIFSSNFVLAQTIDASMYAVDIVKTDTSGDTTEIIYRFPKYSQSKASDAEFQMLKSILVLGSQSMTDKACHDRVLFPKIMLGHKIKVSYYDMNMELLVMFQIDKQKCTEAKDANTPAIEKPSTQPSTSTEYQPSTSAKSQPTLPAPIEAYKDTDVWYYAKQINKKCPTIIPPNLYLTEVGSYQKSVLLKVGFVDRYLTQELESRIRKPKHSQSRTKENLNAIKASLTEYACTDERLSDLLNHDAAAMYTVFDDNKNLILDFYITEEDCQSKRSIK